MKPQHLILALGLSAAALSAQAQTDNVRRRTTATTPAKPAAKPAARPAAKPAARKPATTAKPAAKTSPKTALGEEINVDGATYTITGTNTCAVTECYDDESDFISIVPSVTINGTKYSVTTIDQGAFWYKSNFAYIDLPNSLTTIGEHAFAFCEGLTSIDIPESVTAVEESAFAFCTSLTTINIPSSLTDLIIDAFESCYSLENINVDPGNEMVSSINGVLFNKNATAIWVYPMGKKSTAYSIPSSVRIIEMFAFGGCERLTDITIPSSVITINDGAFYGCRGLTSLDLPSSIKSIGEDAFNECENLTSINCFAQTPPKTANPHFPAELTVHVPRGCAEAYRQANDWSLYTIIDDL